MTEKHISYAEDNFEQVYMVGIKLQPGAHQEDLYALVLYNEVARNDENRPLTREGRIIFFRSPEQRNQVLELGDVAFRKYKPLRSDLAYVYDVPRVLHIVEHESRDEPGLVADFTNELLDFVSVTGWRIPEPYRQALHSLADSTTFDKDLGALDAEATRRRVCDAILWCLGAVLARSELHR